MRREKEGNSKPIEKYKLTIKEMKKLLVFCLCVLALGACKDERKEPVANLQTQQNDSLQKILEQRDNEINDMMATLNEIQEGFRQINQAEDRVTLARDGEGSNKKEQIQQNMQFIQETMAQNRQLIQKMQQQLRESTMKSDEMKKTIQNMLQQLEEKDKQVAQLRAELEAKDIHISELDQTITSLNNDVEDLKTESSQKTQTITEQDRQLNTAYYVFGTKSELREQGILDKKGDVLKGNYNKNYFTKIDIRVDKEIKLYSKKAELKSSHPAGSYSLNTDATGQYVLRITNPQQFWSTSKYLVILVK